MHAFLVVFGSVLSLWTLFWAIGCVVFYKSEYNHGNAASWKTYAYLYILPLKIITNLPSRMKHPEMYRADYDPQKDPKWQKQFNRKS